jgi:hypothetical protein
MRGDVPEECCQRQIAIAWRASFEQRLLHIAWHHRWDRHVAKLDMANQSGVERGEILAA